VEAAYFRAAGRPGGRRVPAWEASSAIRSSPANLLSVRCGILVVSPSDGALHGDFATDSALMREPR
jgi:hypothetical protein